MKADRPEVFVAVDIGASSGRVILGRFTSGGPHLEIIHRFANGPMEVDGSLRWDIHKLYGQVLHGLTLAAGSASSAGERIVSIGVDTWAVDYGLIDDDGGALAALPYSYRDGRGGRTVDTVHGRIPFNRLYGTTGLQFLPFNTVYQLASESSLEGLQALLIPDLLGFWLTGQRRSEATNASTTGLLDATSGNWAGGIFDAVGIPSGIFPPLIQPGQTIGILLPEIADRTGLPEDTAVIAVGSHDTASAVVAVPSETAAFAYVSSGTWSLVGVELPHPVLSVESRSANFTNERGVDGTIRYLRNVGGLWLLQECLRTWADQGVTTDFDDLLEAAAQLPPGGPLIDVDSPSFIPPGGMPERIRDAVAQGAQPDGSPGSPTPGAGSDGAALSEPAGVVRCILDSLAVAYARTVREAIRLAGHHVDVVHIVGGGSQNRLLCQLTADATQLPVIAGPVEATALGNVMVQARAAGAIARDASLATIRAEVRKTARMVTYSPGAAPEPAGTTRDCSTSIVA
ncbi:rhamnulokinase [Arthrobacter sp. CAN_A214]|uniref:rhamnulokinase n=1 Tax=Arthrobacter sp. CAN_A214 TaxID=2787720 RepID=UPI0018CB77E5